MIAMARQPEWISGGISEAEEEAGGLLSAFFFVFRELYKHGFNHAALPEVVRHFHLASKGPC